MHLPPGAGKRSTHAGPVTGGQDRRAVLADLMEYFQLICEDCQAACGMLSTEPGELIGTYDPGHGYGCRCGECDQPGVRYVLTFKDRHAGHSLAERIYQPGAQPGDQQEKESPCPATR